MSKHKRWSGVRGENGRGGACIGALRSQSRPHCPKVLFVINLNNWLAGVGRTASLRIACVAGHTNATQRRNAPASAVQKWDIGSFRIPKAHLAGVKLF